MPARQAPATLQQVPPQRGPPQLRYRPLTHSQTSSSGTTPTGAPRSEGPPPGAQVRQGEPPNASGDPPKEVPTW